MEIKETVYYLTKEILKVFADNAPVGPGRTICTYADEYNVVAFHTDKDADIQYHISFIISRSANVTLSASLYSKDQFAEPKKTRISFYDKDDTRTSIQKRIIQRIEKILNDNNTLYKAKLIESK